MIDADNLGELIATLGSVDNDEIDWPNVAQTTVLIHQAFRYDYAAPVSELRQRLMVVPPDCYGRQRLVTHKLRVTGRDLDSERHYDSFGNVVLDLTLEEVDRQVEFLTWAVVERSVGDPGLADVCFDHRFAEPSRLAAPDDALRAVASEVSGSGVVGLELAEALCSRVHAHFEYAWGATSVETTAAEAWAGGRGVCQDYAHSLLALCRLCGVSARYVSGHLLGDGGTHAWVEVLVSDAEGSRAVALDPTHDRHAGPQYITVAIGRDYGDVAPVSGSCLGPYPGLLTTHKRAAVTRVEYREPVRRRAGA